MSTQWSLFNSFFSKLILIFQQYLVFNLGVRSDPGSVLDPEMDDDHQRINPSIDDDHQRINPSMDDDHQRMNP